MKAEIISIGTEILLGETTDTNAAFLASQLPLLGINLHWVTQVGDDEARMLEAFRRAWERSDLILTTGGLGPTADDLTREMIAALLDEKMEVDPALVDGLKRLFATRHMDMPVTNLKQATLIPSASALHNSLGTAPGWWVEKDGRVIIAMPGPPREMQKMWHDVVVPKLHQKCQGDVILSRTIKTSGLGEAKVGELAFPLFASNPSLGVYARPDGIQLRLTARTQDHKQAEQMLAEGEAKIRGVLSEYIWGMDDDTLEVLIGGLLKARSLKLATVECWTGGLLASIIHDVPDSPSFFSGGLVIHSNGADSSCGITPELVFREGIVSQEAAVAMAEAARARFGADIGMSTTGMEGHPGGMAYIGISTVGKKTAFGRNFPDKRRIVTAALFELRKLLLALD